MLVPDTYHDDLVELFTQQLKTAVRVQSLARKVQDYRNADLARRIITSRYDDLVKLGERQAAHDIVWEKWMRKIYTEEEWQYAWMHAGIATWGGLVGAFPLVWPEAEEELKTRIRKRLFQNQEERVSCVRRCLELNIPQARLPRAFAQETRIMIERLLQKEDRAKSRVIANLAEKLIYTTLSSIVAGWPGEGET